jgi:beta-lactamase superfamily II metal-dependent hydrolase
MARDRATVFVLNVGQGNSVVVLAPDGGVIVIDCYDGPKTEALLRSSGADRIDLLVTTHPHFDHLRGVPHLMRCFPVGSWWDPAAPCALGTYHEILQLSRERALRRTGIRGLNIDMELGEMALRVISPSAILRERLDREVRDNNQVLPRHRSFNDYSFVLRLAYRDFSMVLGGDAEMEAWAGAVEVLPGQLRCQVLLMPHHGSCRGSYYQLIERMAPGHLILSYGEGNRYGHPDRLTTTAIDTYLSRGRDHARVWHTARDGTIVIESTGSNRPTVRGTGERPEQPVPTGAGP